MKILAMSDLHLEFGWLQLHPYTEFDLAILAGDIGVAKRPSTYIPFLQDLAEFGKPIVYVLGNHEFYKHSFITAKSKIEKEILDAGLTDIYILENETITHEDVTIAGCTFWTDMGNQDVLCRHQAKTWMNDYKIIRTGTKGDPFKRKLDPNDTVALHLRSVEWLELQRDVDIVVTHMAPSHGSVSPQYKGDPLTGAYVSDREELIKTIEPKLWIHGHTHESFDYMVGKTRVVCNPRGYAGEALNKNFDNMFTVEI